MSIENDQAIALRNAIQTYVVEEIKVYTAGKQHLPTASNELLPRDNALRALEDTIHLLTEKQIKRIDDLEEESRERQQEEGMGRDLNVHTE